MREYNEKTPNYARVDQVKDWLELPAEKRPHMISLYFSDVDSAGHKFGPESPEVRRAVLDIDRAIARLLSHLEKIALPVNVVIVSDHGMQELDAKGVEYLDDYTDMESVQYEGDGLQASLYFRDKSKMAKVYGDLKAKAKHFQIYKREEMPDRFHYSKSPRCGDLIIVTEAPYSVSLHRIKGDSTLASHAYDPDTHPKIHVIFYFNGPQVN